MRTHNEDAYMLRAHDGLFLVCDGMGGGPAGEVASQLAIDAIGERLRDPDGESLEPSERTQYLERTSRLAAAVRWSNACIFDRALKDPAHVGMGTTVVGAWIQAQIASVAHVGDSRAYLWRDGCLEALTRDHSLARAHVEAGLVARETDVPVAQQHVLVRVLGREPDVDVDVTEVPVRSGDYVLLCSDGLTRMVPECTLATAIAEHREPQRICDVLIAEANGHGGADNITVVVIELSEPWWRRLVERIVET